MKPTLFCQSPRGPRVFLLVLLAWALTLGAGSSVQAAFYAGEIDCRFVPPTFEGTPIEPEVDSTLPLPDGRVLVGGVFFGVNQETWSGLVMLRSDGSIDEQFGLTRREDYSGTVQVRSFAAYSNNTVVVMGRAFPKLNGGAKLTVAWRIHLDGSIDPSFGLTDSDGIARAATVMKDGRILVTFSRMTQANGLARTAILRLNADGSVDPDFNAGPGPRISGLPFGYGYAVAVDDQQRVVLGGSFDAIGTIPSPGLVRFLPDGTRDSTFESPLRTNSIVRSLLILPDGRLMVAGDLRFKGGGSRTIARLLPDGNFDPEPGLDAVGVRVSNPLMAPALDEKGRIWIAGQVTLPDVVATQMVARIFPDGRFDTSLGGPGMPPLQGNVSSLGFSSAGDVFVTGTFRPIRNGSFQRLFRLRGEPTDPPPPPPPPSESLLPALGKEVVTNAVLIPGESATLKAAVRGDPKALYRWFRNGNPMLGETNAFLHVTDLRPGENAVYQPLITLVEGELHGTISSIYAGRALPLAEALDTPGRVWISGASGWIAESNHTADGVLAVSSVPLMNDTAAWLESHFYGPGRLSFHWQRRFAGLGWGSTLALEGGSTGLFAYGGDWEQHTISISAGWRSVLWSVGRSDDRAIPDSDMGLDLDLVHFEPTVKAPPALRTGPFDTVGMQGYPSRLYVIVDSCLPASYLWLKDGTPVVGADGAQLSFTSIADSDAGRYSVIVSNAYGAVTSPVVSLSVAQPQAVELTTAIVTPEGGVAFEWASIPGLNYEMVVSQDLEHWSHWSTTVADDFVTRMRDSIPAQQKRFFRVLSR